MCCVVLREQPGEDGGEVCVPGGPEMFPGTLDGGEERSSMVHPIAISFSPVGHRGVGATAGCAGASDVSEDKATRMVEQGRGAFSLGVSRRMRLARATI